MRSLSLITAAAAVAAPSTTAFSSSAFMGSRMTSTSPVSSSALSMRVVDIDSPDAFDKTIESAGGALVVVDYSTTWCGPCKVIAPKFDELSDQYPDAVFLKVSCFRFNVAIFGTSHHWRETSEIEIVTRTESHEDTIKGRAKEFLKDLFVAARLMNQNLQRRNTHDEDGDFL